MSDTHNEESGCYDEKLSNIKCNKCNTSILYSEKKFSIQEDGTYICPACQHDIDAEKLRAKMGRD